MSALRPWEVALAAAGMSVAGLVLLALAFAGPATYREIALREDIPAGAFLAPGWPDPALGGGMEAVRYPLDTILDLHRATLAYVMGAHDRLPASPTRGDLFSPDEQHHLADVRGVLSGARAGMIAALVGLAALAVRAGRRGVLLPLLRAAALAALAAVALVAAAAGLAFGPMFLLFHQLFFPQGNFLFDPERSNLLRLYPEAYWFGLTVRIAATFLAGATILAAVSHVASLRQRGT